MKCDKISDESKIFSIRAHYSSKFPTADRIFLLSALRKLNMDLLQVLVYLTVSRTF